MKKDLLILLILIIPSFAILLQKGYFSMHDDLQSMRQYQHDLCFRDGQIPCRWVPDMGYGYGYPLFNFYPPLPYLLGQPLRLLSIPYIDIVKIVGIMGWIASAGFMYLLGRQFWGRKGGLVSAVFYTYAPYHSVDFYVRGAMNEFWALVFYPAIFWSTYKLIHEVSNINKFPSPNEGEGPGVRFVGTRWIPITSLSVAGLMLSHNPMLMIFAPVLIGWCLLWLIKFKTIQSFSHLTIAAIWSAGLAAFFTLPVVFEQKFVSIWTLTSGYFNYLAHFLDIKQIFLNINWGYGSSELGPIDSMSFAVGYLHWIVPLAIFIFSLTKKLRPYLPIILYSLFIILFSLFMSHSKSTFLWQHLKPLELLQFPWRFLTLTIFGASFLAGAATLVLNKKIILAAILASVVILNGNYFHPRDWYSDMTDEKKFSGKSWQLLVTSGIFDYLPIWAPFPPADPAGADLNIVQGEGEYTRILKSSNRQIYKVNILSDSATLELQTYYFPGWRIWLDGVEQVIDPSRDPLLGRIQIDVPIGKHQITARLANTPIRTFSNFVSLISWSMLGLLVLTYSRKHVKIHA